MTRTSTIVTSVFALAIGAAAPVLASDQLAANAGLSPSEASGMSLTEIAAVKFNKDVSFADQQGVGIEPGTGGDTSQLAARVDAEPGASLNALAVAKYNAETRSDDQQGPAGDSGVTMISRTYGATSPARSQLIANAGLTAEEAEGLSLNEIAAYKFNRGATNSEKQTVAR